MKGKGLLLGVSLSLIVALGVPPSVYAAGDGPTGGTVGSNDPDKDRAGATDVYLLACPSGTRSARAKINEGNNEDVQLSVLVVNPHGSATTESGVNGGGSDEAILQGGPGSYLVLVHKARRVSTRRRVSRDIPSRWTAMTRRGSASRGINQRACRTSSPQAGLGRRPWSCAAA